MRSEHLPEVSKVLETLFTDRLKVTETKMKTNISNKLKPLDKRFKEQDGLTKNLQKALKSLGEK